MTTITLLPDVGDTSRREAEQAGTTLEKVANDWLRQHRAVLRRQRLAEQTRRFWAKHAELHAKYPNEYVAFYNDAVLDHGADLRELALRVQANYGELPIVISQVTEPPVRTYKMISSRLPGPLP